MGWFWYDLLSIMPFEILYDILSTDQIKTIEGLIPIPYYNDVLKILKLPRFYSKFKLNIMEFGKRFGSANVRLVKFCINLELYVHIVGCVWYFCARYNDFNQDTWVYKY